MMFVNSWALACWPTYGNHSSGWMLRSMQNPITDVIIVAPQLPSLLLIIAISNSHKCMCQQRTQQPLPQDTFSMDLQSAVRVQREILIPPVSYFVTIVIPLFIRVMELFSRTFSASLCVPKIRWKNNGISGGKMCFSHMFYSSRRYMSVNCSLMLFSLSAR